MASSVYKQLTEEAIPNTTFLQYFRLYETRSKFYMIGRGTNRTLWRVLKIDRLEPSELNIVEDSTAYSDIECIDLLKRIHEGNKSTGGLKFVTACYGIIGFIKFLGPFYMLLVTKRRKIGIICGHSVYAVAQSKMIPVPNSTVQSNMAYSKNENRYKKLLCNVDVTKDFFFSYTYHVMRSFQMNLCNYETGQVLYETLFVWNEFLTRGIRNHLKNTLWTVALVYGFFKQVRLSMFGRNFKLTLIARRSRHYAGTRYLKRGVNEKGRVANDVETEQIVFEDVPDGCPIYTSSVVQNRGSIPLFWSQESSPLNIKPDIILSKKDLKYEATKLHFENLVKRYGNPIIILNLIKTHEKKPRESILLAEFTTAIKSINIDLTAENRLKLLHWDLNKYSKGRHVLERLGLLAASALDLTGFFFCQVTPASRKSGYSLHNLCDNKDNSGNLEAKVRYGLSDVRGNHAIKPPMFQKGILRTNCIDCLDRTNVAQYAFGLVALGRQLHALGLIDFPNLYQDSPLAYNLMEIYESMGDTLALQYGGSTAHNKIFCERRGQWKAAIQSQELFRTLQRYYSNAYMDATKQDAINVFLGHFQPQAGKPALWELDSDQHCNIGRVDSNFMDQNSRLLFKRSLSEGDILREIDPPTENVEQSKDSNQHLHHRIQVENCLSESIMEISAGESDMSYSRYTPSMSCKQLLPDPCLNSDLICLNEPDKSFNWSNFLDVDMISSSGNSCEEDMYERSPVLCSPVAGLSLDNVGDELKVETVAACESASNLKAREQTSTDDSVDQFSDGFVQWVTCGVGLFFP